VPAARSITKPLRRTRRALVCADRDCRLGVSGLGSDIVVATIGAALTGFGYARAYRGSASKSSDGHLRRTAASQSALTPLASTSRFVSGAPCSALSPAIQSWVSLSCHCFDRTYGSNRPPDCSSIKLLKRLMKCMSSQIGLGSQEKMKRFQCVMTGAPDRMKLGTPMLLLSRSILKPKSIDGGEDAASPNTLFLLTLPGSPSIASVKERCLLQV